MTVDTDSKDLCGSCRKAFECMGQGVFGTEFCTEWQPRPSKVAKSTHPPKPRPTTSGSSAAPPEGGEPA